MHRLARYYVERGGASRTWLAGFDTFEHGEPIRYPSALPGVDEARLARATDGRQFVEWKTVKLPPGLFAQRVTLVWLAGLGCNLGDEMFDLRVNGEPVLAFRTAPEPAWSVEGVGQAELRFEALHTDEHGDHFGYMTLTLPASELWPDAPVTLRVTGRDAGSRAWFMIHAVEGVLEPFHRAAEDGFWYRLARDADIGALEVQAPRAWEGRSVEVRVAGRGSGAVDLAARGAICAARLAILPPVKGMVEVLLDGEVLDRVDDFADLTRTLRVDDVSGRVLLRTPGGADGVLLEGSAGYALALGSSLLETGRSCFGRGEVVLISSSHQDIGWMETPAVCAALRDEKVLSPALDLLGGRGSFCFSVEQTYQLEEYLARRPERRDQILRATRGSRLEWGATFNQPLEGAQSGEALCRQLYFGRRLLRRLLPGCDSRVAWNLDVPGRTAQMPQLLARAGVPYLVISRHGAGLLRWRAPDGSSVGVLSCGHYDGPGRALAGEATRAVATLPHILRRWEDAYDVEGLPPRLPLICSSDMAAPSRFGALHTVWNALREGPHALVLPTLRHGTLTELLPDLLRDDLPLPEITGERPGVWAYLHGPCHHRAASAARSASELLPQAETFQAVAATLGGSFDGYPTEELEAAWRGLIFPDHGWGGRNGHVTDALFLRKLESAWSDGRRILRDALVRIARDVRVDGHAGDPFVVFNSLPWERDGTLEVPLADRVPDGVALEVVDESGQAQRCQLDRAVDGRRQRFLLHAEDVPSVGYRTIFVRPVAEAPDPAVTRPVSTYENRYYRLVFAAGGLAQIHDEELGVDLVDSQGLRAGEVFCMHSPGHGAGEFAQVQQPTLEGFECASEHPGEWTLLEDGPIRAIFRWQGEFESCAYSVRVVLHHCEKRIDFDVRLLQFDGTPDREFRVAYPLALEGAEVAYEAPFGRVRIGRDEIDGAAGERYVQRCAEIHPREHRRWFGASDERVAVTIAGSTAVFDHVDPTDPEAQCPVLQPILLASRRSCHAEGNAYLQEGDHAYRYSLTSHAPDWSLSQDFGERAARPLQAVDARSDAGSGAAPLRRSFLSVEPAGVRLSTLKKHEDEDALVIRCWESEGRDVDARIRWFRPPESAVRTDLLEEPLAGEREAGEREAGEREAGEREAGEREAGESEDGESEDGESEDGESEDGESEVGGTELAVQDGVVLLPLGHHAIETVRLGATPRAADSTG